MSTYVRPAIPSRVYRDEHSAVIAYGERWGFDLPPDGSYSRTSNLDRFAPLHAVAVEVSAGATRHVVYPSCGCDACDETWEDAADDMETLVLAVAAALRRRPRREGG
ncbi:MAG: DUF6226 family protein [Gordonia sp. (in: high G+C Gram-positive bacteria)]